MYLKGKVFNILLHGRVAPSTADQTLGVEDSVLGVRGQLVLGSISNETLTFSGESHIGWSDAVSLVIGDDLNTAILKDPHTD